ncbi:hypothetical protein [Actibacterium sp. MT2.3-13A]|uniref:hypothetical protein n=1 Tax=Actibacterium sp. MT2.3-13A TaxID=2828332 RepID=UPI001BAD6F9C|nr:hypothetical protein [Actibacterium sp. MT2.3-13A]
MVALAAPIEARTRRPLDILSGGNSASILSMQRGDIPPGINQLRLGAGDELRFAMSYTAVSNAMSAPYPMVAVRD